ncbi:uncharacterized protein LOC144144332 isoform X2 [Haemaphysalis longicornis]
MEATPSKLSLVAQFDDLCRQLRDDTQDEELFLDFVQNQEACRQRWHAAELENAELRRQVAALQKANTELLRKLAHTKDVLEKDVLWREKRERELLSKQYQLEQIRVFMMNGTDRREETLAFLKEVEDSHTRKLLTMEESIGSVLSPSDASDEEEELAWETTFEQRSPPRARVTTEEAEEVQAPRSELLGPIYSSGGTGGSDENTSWCASKSAASGSKKHHFFSPILK